RPYAPLAPGPGRRFPTSTSSSLRSMTPQPTSEGLTREVGGNLLMGGQGRRQKAETVGMIRSVSPPPADVTGLLHAWTGGDVAARDELMAVVYRELHQRAVSRLRRERSGHTLQPTALVNEAYLRLIDQKR